MKSTSFNIWKDRMQTVLFLMHAGKRSDITSPAKSENVQNRIHIYMLALETH